MNCVDVITSWLDEIETIKGGIDNSQYSILTVRGSLLQLEKRMRSFVDSLPEDIKGDVGQSVESTDSNPVK